MYNDWRAHVRPVIEPVCVVDGEVDTAVTHRVTKVVMPVRTVDRVRAGKVHHPRDAGQIVRLRANTATHRLRLDLHINLVMPYRRWMPRNAG